MSPLTDAERLTGYLELCRQARERFRELQSIEWRVNFSMWAFLGGAGYFVANRERPMRVGYLSLVLLFTVCIHFGMLLKLMRSEQAWRDLATLCRKEARTILGPTFNKFIEPPERDKHHMDESDFNWLALQVGTTLLLCCAVVYLAF